MPSPIQPPDPNVSQAIGRFSVGGHVVRAIRSAADATGIGFDVLAAKAAVESGFRPDAQARTSSARGLFQFIDQTWLGMIQRHGADHGLAEEAAAITRGAGGRLSVADPAERARILGLRDNPEVSARMAGEYLKDISDTLQPVLGRRPDAAELYLGHFLGAGGARQVLQEMARDPGQAASAVLPDAAAANRGLFQDGSGRQFSLSEFMGGIRSRLGRAYAEIGATPPDGPIAFQPRGAGAGDTAMAFAGMAAASTPARVAHGAEQATLSALTRVFTRMGRGAAEAHKASAQPGTLPPEILAALRDDMRRSDVRS